jgi:hypothetical protein
MAGQPPGNVLLAFRPKKQAASEAKADVTPQ